MRKTLSMLACIAGIAISHAAEPTPAAAFDLVLVDMQGSRKVLGSLPATVFAPRVSPDARRVAFELGDPPTLPMTGPLLRRLYVADLNHLEQRQTLPFTGPAQQNYAPVWSPDGTRLVYLVSGQRPDALYWRRADGTGEAEHLLDARAAEGMYEGGRLSFITLTGNRDYGIGMLDIGTGAVTRLVDYPNSEQHSSRIAPGGRWFAYVSNETGRQEVWIEPLPQTGKRYQLTKTGGRHPEWSPDGKTLYFDQGSQMFRVDVATRSEVPTFGEPAELPIRGFQQGDLRRQYDLMPDGKGFLMLFPVDQRTP